MADARPSKSALKVGEESGLKFKWSTFRVRLLLCLLIRKLSFSSPSAFSTSCAPILMVVCVSPEASSTLKTCLTATGLILVDYPKTTGRKNPLYKDNTFLLIGKSNATFSEIPSIETWVCEVGLSQKCLSMPGWFSCYLGSLHPGVPL